MLYVYESHMGGYFTTDEQLTLDEEHCDQCGDSDWYLGTAESEEKAEKLYDEWFKIIYD